MKNAIKFLIILALAAGLVIIGLNLKTSEDTPPVNGESGTTEQPETPDPPKPDYDSFAYRTKAYDMLSVEKSKDWLRENHYTVTDSGDEHIIQRNYVSGNEKDTSKFKISKGFKGKYAAFHVSGVMLTTDDDDNIRIGFFRDE